LGQACNQPLHWATPATRTSIRCLKNPHKRHIGWCRINIRESHRLKKQRAPNERHAEVGTGTTQWEFEHYLKAKISGNSCGGNPVKSKFKISVSTSQRTHTTIISTKTDAILGNKGRLLRHTKYIHFIHTRSMKILSKDSQILSAHLPTLGAV